MVFQALDHAAQFTFKIAPSIHARVVAAGHILPDEQAEFVAPVIPAVRLDLHVFATQIETRLLQELDVGAQGLIRRRRVNSVWPETLVESSHLKEKLLVERDP